MDNLGLLYALAAALAWGSYLAPFKLSGTTNKLHYQALMGVGVLISGLILTFLMKYSLQLNMYGIASGILWAVANLISLFAITNLGLSKAIPIISSLVVLTSFLWGSLVFGELSAGLLTGFLGIGLIILGVCLVGSVGNSDSKNIKRGLMYAIVSGIIFGSQFTPVQIAKITAPHFFFAMSVGVFITTMLILLMTRTKLQPLSKEGLLSGAVWNLGNLFGATAVSLIGLAKGLPVTQLAVVVGVIWGILYFREIKSTNSIIQIIFGVIIFLIGVVLLNFA